MRNLSVSCKADFPDSDEYCRRGHYEMDYPSDRLRVNFMILGVDKSGVAADKCNYLKCDIVTLSNLPIQKKHC